MAEAPPLQRLLVGLRWLGPTLAASGAAAAAAIVGAPRPILYVLLGAPVGLSTWASVRVRRRRDRPTWFEEPRTALLVALVALMALGALSPGVETGIALLLVASLALAASVAALVATRWHGMAAEVLAEGFIAAMTIGVILWGFVAEPADLALDDTVGAVLSVIAASAALAVVGGLARLLLTDADARRPAALLTASSAMMTGTLAIGTLRGLGPDAHVADPAASLSPLGVIVFLGLACSHPSWVDLCAPAVMRGARHIARRTLLVVAALLAGPALLVSAYSGEVVPAWFAISAATMLSLTIASYLHMLFRRWGALEHQVHHDALTGLPNRNHFNLHLELAIDHAKRSGGSVLVMFLDLDRFKNVNDSLGHAAGNALLTQVAVRLRDAAPTRAVVARLSGDEFAVLVTDVDDEMATSTAMLDEFSVPFEIGRRQVYVTPSIGLAQYPSDGLSAGELLHQADTAMYRAKGKGRNNVQHYRRHSRASAVSRLDIESGLHRAIGEGQLHLHYQPKVNDNRRIMGVEALLRWDHPGFGAIAPTEFVPIAEESGIIAEIGEWVLLEACAQGRRWSEEQGQGIHIAVNLSPRQFQLQHVPDLVARALRFTKLPPHLLELEITESLALHDPKLAAEALDELRLMGVSCAIDDFGVGYSGLGYIDQFAIDAVKIDRQFVKRIDSKGAPIVTAVIAMAQGLGIRAIAEGVETLEQFDFLTGHGCDELQGFYISRPVPGAAVTQLLIAQGELAVPNAKARLHAVGAIH